ncbi:dienelactone hydrolase family protein [Candidatus Gottesmanbacteria bacterium]|nr:dienelactone hydrolase family protein [Candidatus Gottesmanbacteria bacterium]
MKRWIAFGCGLVISVLVAIFVVTLYRPQIISTLGELIEKPLDKYTIENLALKGSALQSYGPIILDEPLTTRAAYTAYRFHFMSDSKKVTGLAHIPASDTGNQSIKQYPVIVQFRGYVDREKYTPGEGTKRSGEVFAQNGFITLAPDFLGYGGSASPSADVFEERFETYTTALNLLASVGSLPIADSSKIGMWSHSNGGQIALTVLEILGKPIPTTLWAPVSKPFPYSILYYTDDFNDHGKALRKRLAKFERDYDVELYSLTNYLDRIAAPIQIHQGSADEYVPQKWSDELVENLKIKNVNLKLDYFVYPGADHDLLPSWNLVVSRDIEFFRKNLR